MLLSNFKTIKSITRAMAVILSGILFSACPGSKNEIPEPIIIASVEISPQDTYRAPAVLNFSTSDNTSGATYKWDFGDGSTQTGKNVSFTYTSGGTRDVRLTITKDGKETTGTRQVTIDRPYTKVRVSSAKVLNYRLTKEDGSGWDVATTGHDYITKGPDIVIKAGVASLVQAEGGWPLHSDFRFRNALPEDLRTGKITWQTAGNGGLTSKVFSDDHLTSNFSTILIDWDRNDYFLNEPLSPLFGGQSMGELVFKFSDYMTVEQKYPEKIKVKGNPSSTYVATRELEMEFSLVWEE